VNRPRLAVIGNGMAAGRLLDELARRDGLERYAVSVFGEEPHGCYNRILLARMLAGGSLDDITLKPPAWYADHGVRLHAGSPVVRLSAGARRLWTADGKEHAFDAAVFATGSVPRIPPTEGVRRPDGRLTVGVFAFRTAADCERMRAFATPGTRAVVVGGGLLGLEGAKGLRDLGLHVTVVHLYDRLMNAQVDEAGGRVLGAAVGRLGVRVRTGVTTRAVLGGERVRAVRLGDGTEEPADLVVFACGVRPRADLARDSDIPVNAGILVGDTLATAVPGIFAVGECAEHEGRVYGTVQPVYEQCAVLADVLCGGTARYRGTKVYTRLKAAGVEVASMGDVEPRHDTDEVVQVLEERRGVYRKLIVRDGRLAGAVLVGDTTAAAALVRHSERGDLLPENRLDLFASADLALPPADEVLCRCANVPEVAVRDAIRSGCRSSDEVGGRTGAGTGCGSCRGRIAELVLKEAPGPRPLVEKGRVGSDPVPHPCCPPTSRVREGAAGGAIPETAACT
jgi:nitrite reductase (NADH) large subunit